MKDYIIFVILIYLVRGDGLKSLCPNALESKDPIGLLEKLNNNSFCGEFVLGH